MQAACLVTVAGPRRIVGPHLECSPGGLVRAGQRDPSSSVASVALLRSLPRILDSLAPIASWLQGDIPDGALSPASLSAPSIAGA